ncbi:hypothetical protein EIP91_006025 [Steccherinum ochraceum]|uniref:Uncharacterized protein n=1 Tax=Steccherinum ochraceum TaxID=92696 RepID=A0A4R0REP9_9APHY|nr:hypothetical protein EIP91_006025 [Steccherinum ochraceum]
MGPTPDYIAAASTDEESSVTDSGETLSATTLETPHSTAPSTVNDDFYAPQPGRLERRSSGDNGLDPAAATRMHEYAGTLYQRHGIEEGVRVEQCVAATVRDLQKLWDSLLESDSPDEDQDSQIVRAWMSQILITKLTEDPPTRVGGPMLDRAMMKREDEDVQRTLILAQLCPSGRLWLSTEDGAWRCSCGQHTASRQTVKDVEEKLLPLSAKLEEVRVGLTKILVSMKSVRMAALNAGWAMYHGARGGSGLSDAGLPPNNSPQTVYACILMLSMLKVQANTVAIALKTVGEALGFRDGISAAVVLPRELEKLLDRESVPVEKSIVGVYLRWYGMKTSTSGNRGGR